MKTTETCKALEMLEKCSVIELDGYLIHNWYLDTLDCDDDEMREEVAEQMAQSIVTNVQQGTINNFEEWLDSVRTTLCQPIEPTSINMSGSIRVSISNNDSTIEL